MTPAPSGKNELKNMVSTNASRGTPPTSSPRIFSRGPAPLFHRPVICTARGVRVNLIRRAPHDIHAAAIGFPSRNAGSKVFVGVGDAAVMLFFKVVLRQIRVAASPQPELLDKLFALFVGIQLQER